MTPFTEDHRLDEGAIERLMGHVIDGGVHGVFIPGTTGECASLPVEIRQRIVECAIRVAGRRIPVIVNISASAFRDVFRLADHASETGADLLALSPPWYFPLTQAELARYCERIAGRVSLPLILYNAPQHTGTSFEPDTVARLAAHERITGIKDSSGQKGYLRDVLALGKSMHFMVFAGPEKLLGLCVLLGGNGGVPGGANLFPQLYIRLYRAARERDREEMTKWESLIVQVHARIYQASRSPMAIVQGLKYALSLKGLCSPAMALPVYEPIPGPGRESMAEFLKQIENYGI